MSSTEVTYAEVDLCLGEWSSVMDIVHGGMELVEGKPAFYNPHSPGQVFTLYETVGGRLEEEVEIGDSWNDPVGIKLTEDEVMTLAEILDISDGMCSRYDAFPQIHIKPSEIAKDIVAQWKGRTT